MSENENISEVISLVEEAQKRGKFNLADAIKGNAFPEKEVTIYTDIISARKLYELNEELNKAAMKADMALYDELESKVDELAESIKASKLTFKMVGLPQTLVDEIGEKTDDSANDVNWSRNYICSLMAKSIVSVENADGDIDDHEFTLQDVLVMYENLPRESWATLVSTIEQLTLATGIFKGITDAGFLQKS